MIDITERKEKCFALIQRRCTILQATECDNCKFYKPKGCEDWVRIDKSDRILLAEPEEYFMLKGDIYEQDV